MVALCKIPCTLGNRLVMLVLVCGPGTKLTDMSVDLTFSNSSAVIPQHILRLSLKNNKKEETGF